MRRRAVRGNSSPMRYQQQMRSFVRRRSFRRCRHRKTVRKLHLIPQQKQDLVGIQNSLSRNYNLTIIRQQSRLRVSLGVFFVCSIIYCMSSCKPKAANGSYQFSECALVRNITTTTTVWRFSNFSCMIEGANLGLFHRQTQQST